MTSIYKDKAAVHAVLEFATELAFYYYKSFLKSGARMISIAEPTASGDLISRRHFEEFTFPYLKNFLKRTKKIGALNLVHICGNIKDRLDLLADSDTDVISVDYKVDLALVKEVVGNKKTIAGNVNPVAILQNGSPKEVEEASKLCIKKVVEQAGRFILLPGCDLAPTTPLKNVQAFIQTGLNWAL